MGARARSLRETRRASHETTQKLRTRQQAVVALSRASVCSVRAHAATSVTADETHRDHPGGGDQADPRGLPLPRPTVRGTPAHLPKRGSRCAGVAWLYLWAGHRRLGGTAAPEPAADRRSRASGPPRAPEVAGSADRAARDPVPVRSVLPPQASPAARSKTTRRGGRRQRRRGASSCPSTASSPTRATRRFIWCAMPSRVGCWPPKTSPRRKQR